MFVEIKYHSSYDGKAIAHSVAANRLGEIMDRYRIEWNDIYYLEVNGRQLPATFENIMNVLEGGK